MTKIALLIPCYNEKNNPKILFEKFQKTIIQDAKLDFHFFFINDGPNNTVFEFDKSEKKRITLIHLRKNFGKEIALFIGIKNIPENFDCVITLDCDLQHPLEIIPTLISKWKNDYDQIIGFRKKIKVKNFFKRVIINNIEKLIFKFLKIDLRETDFRLIDKTIIGRIKKSKRPPFFFRGLLEQLSSNNKYVDYEAPKGLKEVSNYNLSNLFNLAFILTVYSSKTFLLIGKISIYFTFLCVVFILLKFFNFFTLFNYIILFVGIGFCSVLFCLSVLGYNLRYLFSENETENIEFVSKIE